MTRRTGATPGDTKPSFPGYDVLSQSRHWDEVTAGVVLARLGPAPAASFFSATEEPTARALLDRLLAQDSEPRIPVFELIDRRLLAGEGDGYHDEALPEDPEAWRRSLAAIDVDSRAVGGRRFHQLSCDAQMAVVEAVRVADGDWHALPAGKMFALWMRYACAAFYSHPWAWNEMGAAPLE